MKPRHRLANDHANSLQSPAERRGMSWQSKLARVLIVVLAYVLATRLINPGFIDWGVPLHSDDWQYFATAHTGFNLRNLIHARPFMTLTLKILWFIYNPKIFFIVLLLPAIFLPYLILRVAENLAGYTVGYLSAFIYFFLCFSLSTFYELSILDFGGTMSGVVACIYFFALNDASASAPNGCSPPARNVLIPLLFAWMSIEFKPTYSAVMVALPFCFVAKIGGKRATVQAILTAVVVLAVMLKDVLLGSPFILLHPSETDTYAVARSFGPMVRALLYYAKWLMPLAALPILAVAAARLLWLRQSSLVLGIFLFSLLAVIPMLAIPAHLVPMYSWFSSSVSLLLIPLSIAHKHGIEKENRINAGLLLLAAPLVIAAWAIYHDAPEYRAWYAANQRSNADALKAINKLRYVIRPGSHVLIAGVLNAYNPFRVDKFILFIFPYHFDWAIATPERDLPLITHSRQVNHMFSAKEIEPGNFDVVVYFDTQGRFLRTGPAEELSMLDPSHRVAAMFCNSWTQIPNAEAIMCLYAIDEDKAIVALSSLGPVTGANAWTWFALGHAQETLGHVRQAHDAYVKAAAGDASGIFADSARRTEMPSLDDSAKNK